MSPLDSIKAEDIPLYRVSNEHMKKNLKWSFGNLRRDDYQRQERKMRSGRNHHEKRTRWNKNLAFLGSTRDHQFRNQIRHGVDFAENWATGGLNAQLGLR